MHDFLQPLLPITAIIASVAIVGFATGLTIPMVSLRLHDLAASNFLIGTFAAAPALGIVISAFLVRPWVTRIGKKQALLLSVIASGLTISLLKLDIPIVLLWPLRLMMGVSAGLIMSVGESWINEIARDDTRGRVVALYASAFTICQFFGPTVIAALGPDSARPLILVGLLHLLTALALLLVNEPAPGPASPGHPAQTPMSIAGFMRLAPGLCGGVLFFAFFDGTALALFPIYGMSQGYPVAASTLMAGVILAGDACLQLPIGWLSDRMDRVRLYRGCGILTLLLSLSLPVVVGRTTLIWPVLGLLGAAAGGTYTLALIQIGHHFRGDDLLTANAAVSMLWGAGSLAGPLLTGAASMLGPGALPLTLALAASAFLVSTAWLLTGERREGSNVGEPARGKF